MKILFLMIVFVIATAVHADFADNMARAIFQKKVDETYEKAKMCSPLEVDPKSRMDVTDWIKIQPALPEWTKLTAIEETAQESRKYARSIGGNDKMLHCLAGCYISKKLDYKSAVLVGWYKELSDSSDCSKKSSFEKKDYEATIVGARGFDSQKECDQFCRK